MTRVELGAESSQPATHVRQLWWAECTVCRLQSYTDRIPAFASERLLWDTLQSDQYGWTRRDDGRVLCRAHSHVADCDTHGHRPSRWLPHPIEEGLAWRYCQHCGALFDQRITE